MPSTEELLKRAEHLLQRLEALLPDPPEPTDWSAAAHLWRWNGRVGHLQAVRNRATHRLTDLLCIDEQKAAIETNTRQFLGGFPANHVLLWGPRGTGKSSLIKAILNEFAVQGLRLVELERERLGDLPEVIDRLAERPEHFIVYCDDLSFEGQDSGYKALKVLLDGSIQVTPRNILVYATSNRRHLMPERRTDNLEARHEDGELHHSESVEERISLSERFGLWLAFHPFSQDQFLQIVTHWLDRLDVPDSQRHDVTRSALQWALLNGSRSGRIAWQFAKDWAGRHALAAQTER